MASTRLLAALVLLALPAQVQGTPKQQSALAWLVEPLSLKEFSESCHAKKPCHLRNRGDDYHDRISQIADDLFEKLDTRSKAGRFPEVRVTSMGRDVEPFRFYQKPEVRTQLSKEDLREADAREARIADKGPWDAAAVGWGLQNKFSIKQANCQTHSRLARKLGSWLSGMIDHQVRVNLYISPGMSQGFDLHFDADDVFILQLSGSKDWVVHGDPPVKFPIRDWSDSNLRNIRPGLNDASAALSTTLGPGDGLYIPRGWVHKASVKEDEASAHVTVGIMETYYVDVLYDAMVIARQGITSVEVGVYEEVVLKNLQAAAQHNVELRWALPYGWLSQGAGMSPKALVTWSRVVRLGLESDSADWSSVRDGHDDAHFKDTAFDQLTSEPVIEELVRRRKSVLDPEDQHALEAMQAYRQVTSRILHADSLSRAPRRIPDL